MNFIRISLTKIGEYYTYLMIDKVNLWTSASLQP